GLGKRAVEHPEFAIQGPPAVIDIAPIEVEQHEAVEWIEAEGVHLDDRPVESEDHDPVVADHDVFGQIAHQRIPAEAADHDVEPGTSVEKVAASDIGTGGRRDVQPGPVVGAYVAVVAEQDVESRVAEDPVVAESAQGPVIAVAAEYRIVTARGRIGGLEACAGEEAIVAEQPVVSGAAVDAVGAEAAEHHVVAGLAGKIVVTA